MFVNYGDKVNQTKIRQNRILSNRKSLWNVDFIGFLFVDLFYFSEDKVQGDKVVKESISISFINRLGIFIGVVGAIIRYW